MTSQFDNPSLRGFHQVSAVDRYRGLRGVVRRVMPYVERRGERDVIESRCASASAGDWKKGTIRVGWCSWCGLSIGEKGRRKWHRHCLLYFNAARTQTHFLFRGGEIPCGICGQRNGHELDHRVAIGLAGRRGRRDLIRAFLPENLWMVCGECHRAKTRQDRELMSSEDKRIRKAEKLKKAMEDRGQLPGLVGFKGSA